MSKKQQPKAETLWMWWQEGTGFMFILGITDIPPLPCTLSCHPPVCNWCKFRAKLDALLAAAKEDGR